MRNHANILEVTDLKPDLLGFIFYRNSKRFVGDNFNPEIIHALKHNIKTVGVFVNELPEIILEKLMLYKFDFIQLHGTESPEYCHEINKKCKILKSFGIHDKFDWSALDAYISVCDYFLFDTSTKEYGGSGMKFNWHLLENYHFAKPIFLSGGIGPDDVEKIKELQIPNLAGIDINSKFETEPGLKNAGLLKTFINNLR
jgi:phosphoribosylanthranilate isomerase